MQRLPGGCYAFRKSPAPKLELILIAELHLKDVSIVYRSDCNLSQISAFFVLITAPGS